MYRCASCKYFELLPLLKETKGSKPGVPHAPNSSCPVCQSRLQLCGPVWNGKLHEKEFLSALIDQIKSSEESIYKSKSRLIGMLSVAMEELPLPLYVSIPELCHVVKSPQPTMNGFM